MKGKPNGTLQIKELLESLGPQTAKALRQLSKQAEAGDIESLRELRFWYRDFCLSMQTQQHHISEIPVAVRSALGWIINKGIGPTIDTTVEVLPQQAEPLQLSEGSLG